MDYNWEEILMDKSNKELYQISIGNSMLPKSVMQMAKRELEYRNFDFGNLETHKAIWKLTDLLEDEELYQSEVLKRKTKHISLKIYLLIIAGLVIIFLLFVPVRITSVMLPLFISLATILVILNNYLYKKEQGNMTKRRQEIIEITTKLSQEDRIKPGSSMDRDLKRLQRFKVL